MNALRRKEKAMAETEALEMLRTAQIGRLGLSRNNHPYVVPVNFVYDRGHIYFHSAEIGTKIEFMRSNPSVCFEADEQTSIVTGAAVCDCATEYRSVIAFGTAKILEDLEEKTAALKLIVAKYAGHGRAQQLNSRIVESYRSASGSKTAIVKVTIDQMTGKCHAKKSV